MPVDPLTAIGAAKTVAEGIGFLRKLVDKIKDSKALPGIQDAVQSVQASLLDLQAAIMELQGEQMELREKNRQLAAQVRDGETWAEERQCYERCVVGRAMVLRRAGEPGINYCPNCFHGQRLHQLHDVSGGQQACSGCDGLFETGYRKDWDKEWNPDRLPRG